MKIKSVKIRTDDGRKFKTAPETGASNECEGCCFFISKSGRCDRPSHLFTQACSDAQAIWKEVKN